MKAIRIAFKEIKFRWRSSLIVVAIVSLLTGIVSFFGVNRAGFDREVKRNTRDIGSNVVILPSNVDQVAYHNDGGFSDQTMTEDVVKQLIEHKASLNHLIPMLEVKQEISHGGKSETTRIVGISASIPMPGRPKAPMQKAVQGGTVQIGSALAKRLAISNDQPAEVSIGGKLIPVSRVNRETGTWQDSAAFMDLKVAQEVFDLKGRISRIEAIECTSEKCRELGLSSTVVLTNELATATDKAQILRRKNMADARVNIRNMSGANLLLLTNAMWFLLVATTSIFAASNAIQRKSEIGLFRAIGFTRRRILGILVSRSVFLAITGTVIGVIAGSLLSVWLSGAVFSSTGNKIAVDALAMLWIGLIAVALSGLATLIPAMIAASRHPAEIIGKDCA